MAHPFFFYVFFFSLVRLPVLFNPPFVVQSTCVSVHIAAFHRLVFLLTRLIAISLLFLELADGTDDVVLL